VSIVRDQEVSTPRRVMMVDALQRPVPTTFERATTEVVRSRSHLAAARESLELAVGILRQLNGHSGVNPDSTVILETVIGELGQAEAALQISI
jgi:hypothetical protein